MRVPRPQPAAFQRRRSLIARLRVPRVVRLASNFQRTRAADWLAEERPHTLNGGNCLDAAEENGLNARADRAGHIFDSTHIVYKCQELFLVMYAQNVSGAEVSREPG